MVGRVSCSSEYYVAKDYFELRVLCLENWAKGMHYLSYFVYVLLRIKPRAPCMLGRYFSNRALPQPLACELRYQQLLLSPYFPSLKTPVLSVPKTK